MKITVAGAALVSVAYAGMVGSWRHGRPVPGQDVLDCVGSAASEEAAGHR